MGRPVPVQNGSATDLDYVGVKAPQFSFTRLEGADPVLGVEMASTGEVGCLGDDFEEAFLKALLSVGFKLPVRNVLLSTGPIEGKAAFLESARTLREMGVGLYATHGTAAFLKANGIDSHELYWPNEPQAPNTLEVLGSRGRRPRHQHPEEHRRGRAGERLPHPPQGRRPGHPVDYQHPARPAPGRGAVEEGPGRAADQELAGVRAGRRA